MQERIFLRARFQAYRTRSSQCHPPRLTFTRTLSDSHGNERRFPWSQHPVRILGPAIWSATAIGIICFTCAAYDVYQDAQTYSKSRRRTLTFEQLEADTTPQRTRDISSFGRTDLGSDPIAVSSPLDLWRSLSGPGKVLASVVGLNTFNLALSYVPSAATTRFVQGLSHIPVEGGFRYRQLLTSSFAHTGPLHLCINMFVLSNFASSLARTPEFEGSGSHTLAFYLSAGIMSALGHHVATKFWPNRMARFHPALGFSGVVAAVVAAWCLEHPDGRVQILFIPYDFTARVLLDGLIALEVAGLLGIFNRFVGSIGIAHSSHLSGLLFGAAYVTYGKRQRFWTPLRRAAFRSLKSVGAT